MVYDSGSPVEGGEDERLVGLERLGAYERPGTQLRARVFIEARRRRLLTSGRAPTVRYALLAASVLIACGMFAAALASRSGHEAILVVADSMPASRSVASAPTGTYVAWH